MYFVTVWKTQEGKAALPLMPPLLWAWKDRNTHPCARAHTQTHSYGHTNDNSDPYCLFYHPLPLTLCASVVLRVCLCVTGCVCTDVSLSIWWCPSNPCSDASWIWSLRLKSLGDTLAIDSSLPRIHAPLPVALHRHTQTVHTAANLWL